MPIAKESEVGGRREAPPREEDLRSSNIAYVFPGQGSQSAGMGSDLHNSSRAAREVFEEADTALGFRLSRVIFEGTNLELQDTVNAQPAILTVSIALLTAIKDTLGEKMYQPTFVAGHSLGQYTSLVAAGVMSFSDCVRLVRERGRLMQKASEERPGGMAAIIGLSGDALEQICSETGVEIANVNSDEQTILSGDKIALARAMDLASARGARQTMSLSVSGGFHSTLMINAKEGLREALSHFNFEDPKVPIVANSNSEILARAEDVKRELVDGLCATVRWRDGVKRMVQLGVTHIVEVGPGRALSNLARRIDRDIQASTVNSLESIKKFAEA